MHGQGSAKSSSTNRDSSHASSGEKSVTVADLVATLAGQMKTPSPDSGKLLESIDALRSKLRHQLLDHDDELLEEAVFAAPWLTGFAEALRHDHRDLLSSLDTLYEKVSRWGDQSIGWEEVHKAHGKFVERLEKHDEGCRNLLYESQMCQGHLHD